MPPVFPGNRRSPPPELGSAGSGRIERDDGVAVCAPDHRALERTGHPSRWLCRHPTIGSAWQPPGFPATFARDPITFTRDPNTFTFLFGAGLRAGQLTPDAADEPRGAAVGGFGRR